MCRSTRNSTLLQNLISDAGAASRNLRGKVRRFVRGAKTAIGTPVMQNGEDFVHQCVDEIGS
jgi:hypothetical protein